MKNNTLKRRLGSSLLAAAALGLSATGWAQYSDTSKTTTKHEQTTTTKKMNEPSTTLSSKDSMAQSEAKDTLNKFLKADPQLQRRLDQAVGWAILPTVAKGAVGIGAASGSGVVFEKGKAVGNVSLSQVTVGLALGGQSYSELILFEDRDTLNSFKRSQFTMAAQMSAVAASAGASANAKYVNGVQVYTITKGGLMYEASIGGQKFTFTPYAGAPVG